MLIVSSTVGSPIITGWKRRSSAASFSMYLRYSSSVVAPTVCSSPRASIGLSMLEASIEPSAAPAPTTVCSSSMKRIDLPGGVGDFLQHRLQPFLELAAVLRAGDQRAHVERDDPLVLQPFGHVLADDALGQPFDDRGLADAGLADEHRVVLGAAREHLDHAADLVVAPDHRIELALSRQLGQVAAVALERLIRALRDSGWSRAATRGPPSSPGECASLRDAALLEQARRTATAILPTRSRRRGARC